MILGLNQVTKQPFYVFIYVFILFYSETQTNKTEPFIINILLKCLLRQPLVNLHSKTLNLNLYYFEVRFHVSTD